MPRYSAKNETVRGGISRVYLDGEIAHGVVLIDTDEGWVERNTGRIVDEEFETERLHGDVEVVFKDDWWKRMIEREQE